MRYALIVHKLKVLFSKKREGKMIYLMFVYTGAFPHIFFVSRHDMQSIHENKTSKSL